MSNINVMFRRELAGYFATPIAYVFIVILSLSGCSQPPMATPDHVPQVESAIILVPGYYGTRLVRETDDRLIFISLTQALFGDQSLTLPVPGLGFEGTVNWDPSKPDGQPRRKLDVTRAEEYFGFTAEVALEEGLKRTIAWYEENQVGG